MLLSSFHEEQGLHLIAISPDHELQFSRANDHDLIRLERFTLVTYKKRGKSGWWFNVDVRSVPNAIQDEKPVQQAQVALQGEKLV